MNSSAWPIAAAFVQKWEGGFVDDPSDPGGATNFGVSLRWLRDIGIDVDGDGDVDADDVRALSPVQALGLFRQRFWDALSLDDVPGDPAVCIFDAAVNCGARRSVLLAQQVCNAYTGNLIAEDGVFGPGTRARIQSICYGMQAEDAFATRLLASRERFYHNLVEVKPELGKFLGGWKNRVNSLRQTLGVQ
ncbi:MAG: hypothetical protein KKF77_03430 [Proteobacteria bacterium]|nr:hypothetical protein [Pseudomonadota bacterium]